MKTNASKRTIIQAVENVSAAKYGNNVIFAKLPRNLTKWVMVFTLRTKDAKKAGSLTTVAGLSLPKVNINVVNDVAAEILRLEPQPHIYVDTNRPNGRLFNDNPVMPDSEEETTNSVSKTEVKEEAPVRTKRKYTRRAKVGRKPKAKGKVGRPRKLTTVKAEAPSKRGRKKGSKNKPKTDQITPDMMKALKHLMAHPELMNQAAASVEV